MSALILFVLILDVSLVLAPLFVRQLAAERRRWALAEENEKLWRKLSGKVLVRNGIVYDIHDPVQGLVPKGTVILLDGWPQESDLFEEPSYILQDNDLLRMMHRLRYESLPVYRPSSPVYINKVT